MICNQCTIPASMRTFSYLSSSNCPSKLYYWICIACPLGNVYVGIIFIEPSVSYILSVCYILSIKTVSGIISFFAVNEPGLPKDMWLSLTQVFAILEQLKEFVNTLEPPFLIIPRETEGYRFQLVRPSVCLSVRPHFCVHHISETALWMFFKFSTRTEPIWTVCNVVVLFDLAKKCQNDSIF